MLDYKRSWIIIELKTPKKRIQINPNERFKNIEAIKLAMDQAEDNSAETVRNRRAKALVRIVTDEAATNRGVYLPPLLR